MIHLNSEIGRSNFLLGLFSVQQYEASSVGDFIDNRRQIRPSRRIIPVGILSPWLYWGKAVVGFINVNYRRGETSPQIWDMTGYIDIKFDGILIPEWMFDRNQTCHDASCGLLERDPYKSLPYHRPHSKIMLPERRLFEVTILYDTSEDMAIFHGVTPDGPPNPEIKEKEKLPNLVPEYSVV